ncbi:MAG: hypothetical protein WBM86_31105 [Waterburya sp.]
MEPLSITASAIATLIFSKALEKGGEQLGEAVFKKIGQIVSAVRDKFKGIGMEGVLTQAQDNPNEPNQKFFQQALEMQMTSDSEFANKLIELKEQLENLEGGRQIMASGVELEGNLKAKDMKQKGGKSQEMLTDVKAKNIDLGNLTQEN